MERGEPALKPEWLKSPASSLPNGGGGGASNGALSHHHHRAGEHSAGFSSRSKLTSVGDRERNSFSSCKRSSGLNGSRSSIRDTSGKSRTYSSFGKSNHSREQGRDFDSCDREIRLDTNENGFHECFGRSKRDTLRRPQSLVTRKPLDLAEGLGVSPSNGVHPRGSIVSPSFEKDFPSLGADDKNGRFEVGRVSPSINSPIKSIPIPSAVNSRLESWNSVLVEAPTTVSDVSGLPCAAQPTVQVPGAPCSATGLSMAETVAQAPARVRTPPPLSIDAQKNEGSARKYAQLIPLTPSSAKISGLNSSEKVKNKGTRGTDASTAHKLGSQLLSQPVSAALRASIGHDNSKPSQAGGFHILNRERAIPTSMKDSLTKPVTPVSTSQSGSVSSRSPTNQRPKGDGKGVTSSSQGLVGEKRLHSNAKDRNEFFNIIRSKASSCSSATPEPRHISSSSSLSDSEKQINSPCEHMEDSISTDTDKRHLENDGCAIVTSGCPDDWSDNEKLAPEEAFLRSEKPPPEEEAFLRSLGWDDNAEDQCITKEEIDDFNMKYKEWMVFSKFPQVRSLPLK